MIQNTDNLYNLINLGKNIVADVIDKCDGWNYSVVLKEISKNCYSDLLLLVAITVFNKGIVVNNDLVDDISDVEEAWNCMYQFNMPAYKDIVDILTPLFSSRYNKPSSI